MKGVLLKGVFLLGNSEIGTDSTLARIVWFTHTYSVSYVLTLAWSLENSELKVPTHRGMDAGQLSPHLFFSRPHSRDSLMVQSRPGS